MNRVDELASLLARANEFYRFGHPIMSDSEFDAYEQELRNLDPTNTWFNKGVNDSTPKTRKVKLPIPMMSLNKIKTVEELSEWVQQFTSNVFIITPKYDGLSVGLFKAPDGNLKAVTRGNGQIGQDCTEHFHHIRHTLSVELSQGDMIRGEIIFTNEDFEQFKQEHPEAKSPRNSATGLINGDFDVSKLLDYGKLTVVAYNFSCRPPLSKLHQFEALGQSQSYSPYLLVTKNFLLSPTCRTDLYNIFTSWKQYYPMDGLVIDVDDVHERGIAGAHANGNPKYAIAYKDTEFTTKAVVKVGSVVLQLNREGIATPVICLETPIALSDADISRVSGINMQYIEDWGITQGQQITIIRSGEVIPKIVAVGDVRIPFREEFSTANEYKRAYTAALIARQTSKNYVTDTTLHTCPYCGSTLKWDSTHVNKYCPNSQCSERKFQSIAQFCKILGMKGFAEASLRQLFDANLVAEPYELFALKESDLSDLPNWGTTSVNNFLRELKRLASGNIPFAQIAHASGYFGGLGQKTIQLIIDSVGIDSNGVVNNVSITDLCKIDGVQEATAEQFRTGLLRFYDSMLSEVMLPSYVASPVTDSGGVLSGSVYCFTGFRDKSLTAQIESLGGKVADSLSRKVTTLVTKEADSTSTKAKKALDLGIKVISLAQLQQDLSQITK